MRYSSSVSGTSRPSCHTVPAAVSGYVQSDAPQPPLQTGGPGAVDAIAPQERLHPHRQLMASAGAHCFHLNHVFTQLPYALTASGVAFVSFIIAGLVQSVWLCLAIAVALMIGTLLVIRAIVSRRHAGIFQEMAQASQQLLHR